MTRALRWEIIEAVRRRIRVRRERAAAERQADLARARDLREERRALR